MNIRISHLLKGLTLGLLLGGSTAASAAWEFSANFGLTTDYVFRGISQNNEEASMSGGIDFSHDSGFYVGTWAAIVDQAEWPEIDSNPDDTNTELDIYGGYGGNFTDAFSYDVGLIYYAYPVDANSLNFWEIYGSLSYDFGVASVTGGVAYSPDFYGETDDALYYYVEGSIPLPMGFGIDLHWGHQDIDDNVTFGTPDYDEWKVAVTKSMGDHVTVEIAYTDTDLKNRECFGQWDGAWYPPGSDLCDSRIIGSINVDF
jgi:uncharacterized protein (TIGR02001 family)